MKKIIFLIIATCLSAVATFAQSINTYEYDAVGRLTKTTYSNGVKVFYAYDALGNRVSKMVISNPPTGAAPGVFSVSNNKYVYFSQGNLQYQASTDTWRFAENQWDYVGYNQYGNVYENGVKCDNTQISSTYNGWIDLFGWGTSGYNHGAICYQPWSTGEEFSDYSAYGDLDASLFEGDGRADWGYNPIINGGNEENSGWRTPTAAEWDFLFNTRHTSSGIRFVLANVNDVSGVILLPDDWDVSTYTLNNPNTDGILSFFGFNFWSNNLTASQIEALFNSNTIDAATWIDVFVPAGAVFFPAQRNDDISNSICLWINNYWSSTADALQYNSQLYGVKYRMIMGCKNVKADCGLNHSFSNRANVRLIQDVTQLYMVNIASGQESGGTVAGGGSFEYGQTCTVEALPEEGYTFSHWTENGVVVSTDAYYSFDVYTNHNLVAHFRNIQFEDPNLLGGQFTIGEDRVARFAKSNLNLQFSFNAGNLSNVEWSFAEHQWDCMDFNPQAFISDPEGYMKDHGLDLINGRYLYDVNYTDVALDLGCWRTLTTDEWDYLLRERITASGMHFTLGRINNVKGLILFPDDWDAATYPIPYNTIDVLVPYDEFIDDIGLAYRMGEIYNDIPIDDWIAFFEPAQAVFLPLVNEVDYSEFILLMKSDNSYYCSSLLDVLVSGDEYNWWSNTYGYVRPVQIETRDYEIIGAQASPYWAGEVNGAGIFENQIRDGEICTLTATAKSGHTFEGWYESGNLISTESTLSFVVEDSRSFMAVYSADVMYTINAEISPSETGNVEGCGMFEEWQECTLVAQSNDHYHFIGWMEDGDVVSTEASYTFVVTSDLTLQACFAENQSYMLSVNAVPEEGGIIYHIIYLDDGSMIADENMIDTSFDAEIEEFTEFSLLAYAKDGYHFVGWMVGDEIISVDNIYNFQFPSNDFHLEAYFELCEVESEPDPDLLSGRFSINECTTVGFARGNTICYSRETTANGGITTKSITWDFADYQYYRQAHGLDGEISLENIEETDLFPSLYAEYLRYIDIDCWHLLSSDEWDYLFNGRDIEVRYAFAKVNNVEGLLVLPDNWNPTTYSLVNPNITATYETNIISRYVWNTVLEPAGALFLPANGFIVQHNGMTGYCLHDNVGDVVGYYAHLYFSPSTGVQTNIWSDAYELALQAMTLMRLAQIVETETPTVTLEIKPSQINQGQVSGGGEFTCSSECTIMALPNDGYVFRYWLEEGEVVSTDAVYTFQVTKDRNLIAEFANENEVCNVAFTLFNDQSMPLFGWADTKLRLSFDDGTPDIRYTIPKIDFNTLLFLMGNNNNLGLPESMDYSICINKGTTVNLSYEGEQGGFAAVYDNVINFNTINKNFSVAYYSGQPILEEGNPDNLPFEFESDCSEFLYGFVGGGQTDAWHDPNNWRPRNVPSASAKASVWSNVKVNADATVSQLEINDDKTVTIAPDATLTISETLVSPNALSLVVEDGGQLVHTNDGVLAKVKRSVTPYTEGEKDGWHLLASPLSEEVSVSEVQNLLLGEYDLYYYDEPTHYWMNQEKIDNNFNTLENGKGYLYGNNGSSPPFEAQVGDGTSETRYFPFYTYYDNSISEILFHAEELENAGVSKSPMTSLSWYATNQTGSIQNNISIWMANVSDNTLTTTSHNTGDMTLVYTGSMTPVMGWNEFVFNEDSFIWDGASSVLICVQKNGAWNSTINWQSHDCGFMGMAYSYRDHTTYDMMNETYGITTSAYRANTIFKGLGGGQGELVTISFIGEIENGSSTVCIPLVFTPNIPLSGFNLVGNPYAHDVISYETENVAEGCFRMNEAKDNLIVSEINEANPLKPTEGFFVKAFGENASITFGPQSRAQTRKSASLRLEITKDGKILDRLLIKDAEGQALQKISLKKNGAKLFALQNQKELAIVPSATNEQAVCFKASKNGKYSLNVYVDGMNLDYLHLIDNLTGDDVDLLLTPSYTFEAKTNDYASRFKLIFYIKDSDGPLTGSGTFAFLNNGNIIIPGAETGATLQIVDMLGHVLVSRVGVHTLSTEGLAKGMYILHLINGEDVKTQKIVIE